MMLAQESDHNHIKKDLEERYSDGKYQLMGYFDNDKKELLWSGRERWAEGAKGPPPDSTIIRPTILTVAAEVPKARLHLFYYVSKAALMKTLYTSDHEDEKKPIF